MKKALILLIFWLVCTLNVAAQHVPLPVSSVPLTSREGQDLLLKSQERSSYWPLSVRYETEYGLSHCGPASAVMVLNALGIPSPAAATHPPFKEYEQDNFFTPDTDKILTEAKLKMQGATLEELGAMLTCHKVEVEVHHAQDGGLDEFRRLARQAVGSQGRYVICNFLRAPLHQEGGGHFSPLAAYNASTDRFLVMDVARYKYPPFWVTAEALFQAMDTLDRTSGKNRGYLIISAGGTK